jgi:hypothetical protein
MAPKKEKKSDTSGAKIDFLSDVISKIKSDNKLDPTSASGKPINPEDEPIVDVMTFCERADLLDLPGNNLRLFLSQRVILKSFYLGTRGNENVELNDEEWNWLYVKQQNSAIYKIKRKTDGVVLGGQQNFNFSELNLACGRRSSKTLLASVICAYEAYKLIKIGDPYKYYNIPYDEEMAIINVANSQKQAGRLFSQIKARIRNAPFFKGRVQGRGESASELRIYTNQDLAKIKSGDVNVAVDGSIVLVCGHSNPDTLRGYSSPCIIFDELQYYTEHPIISGSEFYNTLIPSITKFTTKGDGRLIEISTTGTPSGIFYATHRQGQSLTDEFNSVLGFHLATWDINDDLPYDCPFMTLQRKKDPDSFDIEYGARWCATGFVSKYFPEEKVKRAIKSNVIMQDRGLPHCQYYMHLDPAATRNNYAIVIIEKKRYIAARGEKRYKLTLAKHYMWKPMPGVGLNLPELDDQALAISRLFRPVSITYDTWNSVHSIDYLRRKGFYAKQINYGVHSKRLYYQNLTDLMERDELELYHDDYLIGELLNLKFRTTSKGITIVPDYQAEIDTDDLSDCLAGACWMAVGTQMRNALPTPVTINFGQR